MRAASMSGTSFGGSQQLSTSNVGGGKSLATKCFSSLDVLAAILADNSEIRVDAMIPIQYSCGACGALLKDNVVGLASTNDANS